MRAASGQKCGRLFSGGRTCNRRFDSPTLDHLKALVFSSTLNVPAKKNFHPIFH